MNIRGHMHQIFYGDNNVYCVKFDDIDFKWKQIGCLLNKRSNTSLCMVDNDRFIAILGGTLPKCAELYALNCNKSIRIRNMIQPMEYTKSIYHDKFHKIIVADRYNKGIQLYDINKDKWDIIQLQENMDDNYINDIFICNENPNYLYMIGNKYNHCFVDKVDLRMKQFINDSNTDSRVMTDKLKIYSENCCVIQL